MSREFKFTPGEESKQPRIMSIADAEIEHEGRWILMQIKAYDESENPLAGEVVYTSRSRRKVSKALAKQPPRHEQAPDAGHYYIFHAPPHGNWLESRIISRIIGI